MKQKFEYKISKSDAFIVYLFVLITGICFCLAIGASQEFVFAFIGLSLLIGAALIYIDRNAYEVPSWWWTDKEKEAYLIKNEKQPINSCDARKDKTEE